MWLMKRPVRDVVVRESTDSRSGLINSFSEGDFIEDIGETDEELINRFKVEDKLSELIRVEKSKSSLEERLRGRRRYQQDNPEYGLLTRVFDQRRETTLVGEPLPPSLMQRFFPFLFARIPKPERKPDKIIVNYLQLELRGEGIIMYGGTSLSGWYRLREPGGKLIERIRKVEGEKVLEFLERRLEKYQETIEIARSNPEGIYDRFKQYKYSPFRFSIEPQKREQELRLIGCVEAAKHFRLQEVYDILKNASTPYQRLNAARVFRRPGTNFFVVIDALRAGTIESVPPVAIHVIGYDNSKIDNYDYDIAKEIEGRFRNYKVIFMTL